MSDKPVRKPGPNASPVTKPFWDAAREQRLLLQHCDHCRRAVFYPRHRCPHCWSDALSWQEASGAGTVASHITVHRPAHPAFAEEAPYDVALIDLAEGPRMLSNVVDCLPEEVYIGMPVAVRYRDQGDATVPVFYPLTGKAERP